MHSLPSKDQPQVRVLGPNCDDTELPEELPENQSLIENHRKSGSVDTFMNIFIGEGIYSPTYRRLFPVLNASCPADNLENLYLGTGPPSKPSAVWHDDRDSFMRPRSHNGLKTTDAFHKTLRLKVCRGYCFDSECKSPNL